MAESADEVTVRLSKRVSVTICASRLGVTCEWDPSVPTGLTPNERRRYRQARDAAIAHLAARTGLSIAVLET